MATHNLEDPNIFISPSYHNNKFVYRMLHTRGEDNEILVRTIDLTSDRLIIYGTELNESALERLHQSLILVPGTGAVRVNCYGACYFVLPGKVRYRSIHNVIFDWSQFGVTVPNSVNDSLRKKVEGKEKEIDEMTHQLSSVKAEVLSTKAALEASKKETEELKEQLSASKGDQNDIEAKLERLCDQLSSTNSELQSTTTQLELSNERVMELEEQLSSYNKESPNLKIELQKLQNQLSLVYSEFEDQLSFYRKSSLDKEVEVRKLQDELSSVNLELYSTRSQLESSKERVKELEVHLSASKKEFQETGEELQKVQCQLSLVIHELQFTKSQLETSVKMLQELKDQLLTWRRDDLDGGSELQKVKVSDQLWSIDSEVKCTRQKLEELLTELNHSRYSFNKHSLLPLRENNISRGLLIDHEFSNSMNNLAMSIAIEEDIPVK